MEVHVLPLTVLTLPHTSLFRARATRLAVVVNTLNQPVVAYDPHVVSQHSYLRLDECRLLGRFAAIEFEIEAVEIHALDKMTACFGFKCSQCRVAKSLVGLPITAGNAV